MRKIGTWICWLAGGVLLLAAPSLAPAQEATDCECLDMVIMIDDSGSMGGAIENVKTEITNIVAAARQVGGDDARLAVVTFTESIDVLQPFTTNEAAVVAAINGLQPVGFLEAYDEAIRYVVSGQAAANCTVNQPLGPLGAFRADCSKLVIVATDEFPQNCVAQVDEATVTATAQLAASADVKLSMVAVGTGIFFGLGDILQIYTSISGGIFFSASSTGAGVSEAIIDTLHACGEFTPPETCEPESRPAQHDGCITRDARFWFTHPYNLTMPGADDLVCATLLNAIRANANEVCLGFVRLPVDFRNADALLNEYDAVMEALGLYYRSSKKTGEMGGTQNAKLKGSKICKDRKRLAVELMAAVANNALLGTGPENCTYKNGNTITNFPADLIELAGAAIAWGDRVEMKYFRKLLREFNSSGVTNNLPQGIVECSPIRKKELKPIARDPSTASTCPGINDTCLVAENILRVPVKRSLKLNKHTDGEDGPSCFGGGRDAFYRVSPPVAAAGRHFIVDTSDSNFRTLLSVRRGTCNALDEITCSSGGRDGLAAESRVMFTADGTNTFFIAVEGLNGAYGKTKVEIYSY